MKVLKTLTALTLTLILITPVNVFAKEHNHVYEATTSSSREYTYEADENCIITTYTTTQVCECGYKLENKYTEEVPHEWEWTCVDKINNGYQWRCSTCRITKGSIAYPASLEIVIEEE